MASTLCSSTHKDTSAATTTPPTPRQWSGWCVTRTASEASGPDEGLAARALGGRPARLVALALRLRRRATPWRLGTAGTGAHRGTLRGGARDDAARAAFGDGFAQPRLVEIHLREPEPVVEVRPQSAAAERRLDSMLHAHHQLRTFLLRLETAHQLLLSQVTQ